MGNLYTRWGKELLRKRNTAGSEGAGKEKSDGACGAGAVLAAYPRPTMVRGSIENLNGIWDYRIKKADNRRRGPGRSEICAEGGILVPFSPESPLSGVNRRLQPDEVLWYRTYFEAAGDGTKSAAGGTTATAAGENNLPTEAAAEENDRSTEAAAGENDLTAAKKEGRVKTGETSGRLLLHFGAVDAETVVFINGKKAGSHVGGYLPFTLDITDLVRPGRNRLSVRVTDPSDTSYHARGKQRLHAGGMFYTAVSGIWQTVWLEKVPEQYITELQAEPDIDRSMVKIVVHAAVPGLPVRITVHAPDVYRDRYLNDAADAPGLRGDMLLSVEGKTCEEIDIRIPSPRLWTPEDPWLYTFTAELLQGAAAECCPDAVDSYFAMRSFTIEKRDGLPRVCLNHEEIFLAGVLDQGYWPDGIYTAPADAALIYDIEEMKKTGFNMMRKHMKIEPERWYYHCDRLGMIVCQDMVFGGGTLHSSLNTWLPTALEQMPVRMTLPDGPALWWITARLNKAGREEFERDMKETIRFLRNHPSIAIWCIFNESWGQFDAERLTAAARQLDPARLIDSVSGWFDQRCGDFQSIHHYFFRLNYRKKDPRALFLSEYGGYPWEVPDHLWGKGGYGYGKFRSPEELNDAYRKLTAETYALRAKGFCGSVYTQVSDVEDEVNGIFTYDREVRKIKPDGGKTGGPGTRGRSEK